MPDTSPSTDPRSGPNLPHAGLIAVLAAVSLVASGAPASIAQDSSGETTGPGSVSFYGHVFSHGMNAPMPFNTEFPVGEENYGLGFTSQCQPAGVATSTCEESTSKRLALFSTPGFVQVETRAQWQSGGAYAQLHNERGQTQDILLDSSGEISAEIFMTYDFHSWFVGTGDTFCLHPHPPDVPCLYPYWGWDVGANPNAVIQAELYSVKLGERGANASQAPPVGEALDSGEASLIAEGQWTGTMTNGMPGGQVANQITIEMGSPQETRIPNTNDLVLVYKWASEAAGNQYGASNWRVYSGEFFAPSFSLDVKNAITVERVAPQFAHGKLAILGIMNTPWGSYDVAPESVELEVDGDMRGSFTPDEVVESASFSVAHGGHFKPVNKTWIWDYRSEGIDPGTYDVTVTASNQQGTAQHSCTATVTFEAGEEGPVPGQAGDGFCGQQTASEERLEQLKEGAEEQTGGG